jgi:DNA repair exonuclease SbcCD ATPase subunit
LVWDVLDKENYTCVHHVLKNPKPFLTIKLTPKGRLPNKLNLPPGARLRLVSENNLPLGVVRKAIDVVKQRCTPEAVTYLSRSAGERKNIEDATNFLKQDDLRSIAVQEGLIKEYLEDYQLAEKTLTQVFEINKKYNSLAEQDEEVYRNINWRLKKLEWDNLFNYGEGNSIDFENLNGVVGILGKNFSGKSSIIDSLLYTIYNTTSKNNRKNLNLINQNTNECRGYVEIDIGTKTYKIERKSEKYTKKLKGKETQEAKTDVEFDVVDNASGLQQSLNGITRIETDNNIRKVFGTIEDFLMTSMASQLDSLAFLNEGSTRRKEILAKFLDLELFDRKFKMVKEESADLKGALKHLMNRDYDLEIQESRTELARIESKLSVKERGQKDIIDKNSIIVEKINDIDQQIDSIPQEVINIKNVKKQLKECEDLTTLLAQQKTEKQEELKNEVEFLKKIENFINNFDIDSYENKKIILEEHKESILKIENDISKFEDIKKRNDKKVDLLKKVPCGPALQSKCLFVKDARTAIDDHARVTINLNQLSLCKTTLIGKISNLNPAQVDEYIKKYQRILEKMANYKNKAIELELEIEKNKIKSLQLTGLYAELKEKEKLYEENKESIENFENLLHQKSNLESDLEDSKRKISKIKEEILEVYKVNGSLEQKFNEVLRQKEDFINLESEYTASDLFMRCMYSNGISYDIIKKRLPVINNEISKILANIVEFEVFFESDDKKLDILIKHPKHSPRPIDLGSGAEKTIAAMAIRLSLLNVSTLPKGDVFILDEPGTALDAENMEGFIRILDMIRAQFKTVILISHLDSLKDIVDQQLLIEKHKGLAYINE